MTSVLGRKKYFLLHLAFSVLLVSVVTALAILLWFPSPFYWIDGTLGIAVIIAVVDMVLGPVVTLIISSGQKPAKTLLKDMFVVVVIQISVLFYGVHQLYQERVSALVLFGGVVHLLAGKHFSETDANTVDLPQFKGIFYGSLSEEAVKGSTALESRQKMQDVYQHVRVSRNDFILDIPQNRLPSGVVDVFLPDLHRFVPIAGKAKNGVAIFNEQMELVEVLVQ